MTGDLRNGCASVFCLLVAPRSDSLTRTSDVELTQVMIQRHIQSWGGCGWARGKQRVATPAETCNSHTRQACRIHQKGSLFLVAAPSRESARWSSRHWVCLDDPRASCFALVVFGLCLAQQPAVIPTLACCRLGIVHYSSLPRNLRRLGGRLRLQKRLQLGSWAVLAAKPLGVDSQPFSSNH
jgi:hypothetical protein